MVRKLLSALRSALGQNPAGPQFVRVEAPESVIREKMKGDRDFRLRVTPQGEATAFCKACGQQIRAVREGPMAWFGCPSCRRISFYPVTNLQRDTHFAIEDGAPLEYELFYMRGVPPGLKPPKDLLPDG